MVLLTFAPAARGVVASSLLLRSRQGAGGGLELGRVRGAPAALRKREAPQEPRQDLRKAA